MKLKFAILLLASACAVPLAHAQTSAPYTWELGVGYQFVHTNAPPASCGCFSMNGGSASATRQFSTHFGIAAEFSGVANGNVDASGKSLTLLTYMAGPRYRILAADHRLDPYAQVLVGGSHASGGIYGSGATNAFAASIGGGVDLRLTPRVSWRLIDADYLLTLLPNGVNSRQNNTSLSTGILFRFGK
jgi:outer membrane immunogenic protein